jgi:hypothetical protein
MGNSSICTSIFYAAIPWFTYTIKPSLRGASEIRSAFLPAVLKAHKYQM